MEGLAILDAVGTSQAFARIYNETTVSNKWLQGWPSDIFINNSNFPKTVSPISALPSEWQQEAIKIGTWLSTSRL